MTAKTTHHATDKTPVETPTAQVVPAVAVAPPPPPEGKDFLTAALLSYFVGWLGVDRFYMGYVGLGILKLVTFGGCGIWYLIDVILILTGSLKDNNGQELKDRHKNSKLAYIIIGVGFVVFNIVPFIFYLFVFIIAALTGGLNDHQDTRATGSSHQQWRNDY